MFKGKRKVLKGKLDILGEEQHEFIREKEFKIYAYRCRSLKIKKCKDVSEKFDTYGEWKEYVQKKYASFGKNELIDFSRYLNLRINNLNPGREYNGIVIPIVVAVIVNKLIEFLVGITEQNMSLGWPIIVFVIVGTFLIIMGFAYSLMSVVAPIWNDNLEKNFFLEYKEIIDERINDITIEENRTKYKELLQRVEQTDREEILLTIDCFIDGLNI